MKGTEGSIVLLREMTGVESNEKLVEAREISACNGNFRINGLLESSWGLRGNIKSRK